MSSRYNETKQIWCECFKSLQIHRSTEQANSCLSSSDTYLISIIFYVVLQHHAKKVTKRITGQNFKYNALVQ